MIQWGLGQGVLREIWALVAGDAGQLSTQQFISCLYLMDNAKQVGALQHVQLQQARATASQHADQMPRMSAQADWPSDTCERLFPTELYAATV